MRTLTDRNFAAFITNGEKAVICTAGYCGICKLAISKAEGVPNIATIDLTLPESVNTRRKLRIKRVPTVIIYRDGSELRRAEGTTALFNYLDQACKSLKGTEVNG